VFFSWQSDLPKSLCTNFIRAALEQAQDKVRKDCPGISVVLDEATRDTPGSPDIVSTILEKISKADAFVADISTIGTSKESNKPIPNPNVMAEFGYALAEVGYDRCVLLCNEGYTSIKDLPFDIERRRVTPFKSEAPGRTRKETTAELAGKLTDALTLILKKNPRRARLRYLDSPEHLRKESDLRLLREGLLKIHGPSLLEYCSVLPAKIDHFHLWFYENFNRWVEIKPHLIHDSILAGLIRDVGTNWSSTLSYTNFYDDRGAYAVFMVSMDIRTPEQDKAWVEIEAAASLLRDSWIRLTEYIKHNYVEIDLDAISKEAFKNTAQEYNASLPRKATLLKRFKTFIKHSVIP
jgi:hypothetical protein